MKKLLLMLLLATGTILSARITNVTFFPADWLGKQYNFLEGYPSTLVLQFLGYGKELAAAPPTAVFELPEFLELRAVAPRVNWTTSLPLKKENFTVNGRKMVRYKILFPKHLVQKLNPKTHSWRPGVNCIIIPKKGFAGKKADFKFYFLEKGKRTFEQTYPANLLPEPRFPSAPLKYFATGISGIASYTLSDDTPLRLATAYWHKFDKKPYTSASWENISFPAQRNKFMDENFTIYAGTFACRNSTMKFPGTNFKDLGFMVNGAVTRPGVPPFVDSNGKAVRGAICPLYILADPEGLFWGAYFKRGFESRLKLFSNCRDIWFDYEPFVSEGTCDNCLKSFAKFAKLKTVPKRTDIRSGRPLNLKWRQYKAVQHRAILEKFVSSAKKHFPKARLHLCTATPSPNYLDDWSVTDSSTVVNKVYAFNPMNYTVGTTYFDKVAHQEKVLGKTKNFSWVDPAEESERFFRRYTPEKILQNIIATAALGADGITFYPSDILDGKMLSLIARGLSGVKDVEELLAKGKDVTKTLKVEPVNVTAADLVDEKGNKRRITLPDFSKDLRMVLKVKNGVYALALLNYSNREVFLKVAIPQFKGKGAVKVSDVLNELNYTKITAAQVSKGFLVKLPASGSALFRIGGAGIKGKALLQSTLESELKKELAKLNSGNASFKGIQQGDVSLSWVIHKKSPAIRLGVGKQQIFIDPVSALVLTWRNGNKTPLGGPTTAIGELCFYDTANQKKQEYQLSGHKMGKDQLSASFTYVVPKDAGFGEENPLADLKITKEIILKRGNDTTGTLEILTTFTNPCKERKIFGFRFRNIPIGGWKAPKKPYSVTLDGKSVDDGGIYGRPGAKINWHAVNKLLPHKGNMAVHVQATWYRYNFEFPGCAAFYSWSNNIIVTAEPLYADMILPPGASKSFRQVMRFNMK